MDGPWQKYATGPWTKYADATYGNETGGDELIAAAGPGAPDAIPAESPPTTKRQLLDAGIKESQRQSKYYTGKANALDFAERALDVPGAFKSLINLPNRLTGQPDYPALVSPEQVQKVGEFLNPLAPGALPQDEVTQGLLKGGAEVASGLTSPDVAAAALLAKKYPVPVSTLFAGETLGAIPEATRSLLESKTPGEAAERAVPTAANLLLTKLLANHLVGKGPVIPKPGPPTDIPPENVPAVEAASPAPPAPPAPVTTATLDRLETEGKTPNEIQKEGVGSQVAGETPKSIEAVREAQPEGEIPSPVVLADENKVVPLELTGEKPLTPAKASRQFDDLIKQHGYEFGWVTNPDALSVEVGKAGDTASLEAKFLKHKALAQARRNALIEMKLDPGAADSVGGRAKLLEQLKKHIEGKVEEQKHREAIDFEPENADTSFLPEEKTESKFKKPWQGTIDFESYDEPTGKWEKSTRPIVISKSTIPGHKPWRATIFAGGEDMPVAIGHVQLETPQITREAILEFAEQLGRHTRNIKIEPSEIAKPAIPKLRPGEKGTGDLLQGEDAPFNLAGETAVDTERVAREKADSAKKAAEAKSAQKKQQPGLLLGITPGGQQAVKLITEKLSSLRTKLVNSWATRGNKADIARLKDAADNQARIDANQHGESVRLEARRIFGADAPQAQRAVFAVIEAAGDRNRLNTFGRQAHGKDLQAEQAARFAQQHWDRLQPLAAKIKAIHDAQIAEENANGIATEYRENYIKHAFDVEKLPNRGEEFFGSGGGAGARSGFKAARKFETIYDAIEAGYGKAIKSMDAAKLVESRLASGQQLINDRQWVNGFRGIVDPTTNKPLITDVTFDRNHFPIAPAGYDVITPLPGQFLAVHNGYGKIFRAVTDPSKIAEGEIAGLPVGQAVLSTAAGIKHGLLLFDTFHASRIMQKQFFLTWKKPSWNKGLSLLEYTDADLNEAVRQGEITTEMATYARANRGTAQLLMREGLNVGRIQEALRSEIVRNLPVVGTFNKWVFDKVTRGAMMESALIEFERTQANNPAMTPQQVASTVAKKINVTFGNIGRQGLFKSRTFQDLSRLVALAPQWVESMARSEIGGFKELGKVPVDLALGKGLQVGTLGKTMAGGLLAYFVGTQLINLATRGQLTFQNKEDGHKLDAWIPDLTGKTPGFFLNPLSVVAELTHDAYRYAFKKDSAIDVAKEILSNKASPLARSQYTFWSGRNFAGEKIDGTWNRIKASGSALVPAPIPVSGFHSERPGQAQRQLTASLGVKTEPAPTAVKQIADKASAFRKDSGKPVEVDVVYHADSPYNAFRNAVQRGDTEKAMEALQALRKTYTDQQIFQAWQKSRNHPFTGSAAMEGKFRQSLSEDDRKLYDAAKKEKQETYRRFLTLWAQRGARPAKL